LCSVILLYTLVYRAFGERVVPAGAPYSLTVAILPQGLYAASVIEGMTREVANILKHSGLKIEWHLGSGPQVFDEPLAIVKLTGTCKTDSSARLLGKPGPLGWTHSADGNLLPFAEVACDNIRRAIQTEMFVEDRARGNALLGRAMGRVLAHELFHILAATKEHTGAGVTKSALSPAELLSNTLELDPAGVELILDRLNGDRLNGDRLNGDRLHSTR
jgi:hypothetical protein